MNFIEEARPTYTPRLKAGVVYYATGGYKISQDPHTGKWNMYLNRKLVLSNEDDRFHDIVKELAPTPYKPTDDTVEDTYDKEELAERLWYNAADLSTRFPESYPHSEIRAGLAIAEHEPGYYAEFQTDTIGTTRTMLYNVDRKAKTLNEAIKMMCGLRD